MKLTVTNKDQPVDAEFAIVGLGLFKNGKAREVTSEQEIEFEAVFGYKVSAIESDDIKIDKDKGGDS